MTKETMEKTLRDVYELEKELMRPLTESEIQLLMDEGKESILDKLEFTKIDLEAVRSLRNIISAYCTKNIDEYEDSLKTFSSELVADVLISIYKDVKSELTKDQQSNNETKTSIKLIQNPGMRDSGYLEEEDPELNSYFTKESTQEAKDAKTSYDPEDDTELFNTTKCCASDDCTKINDDYLCADSAKLLTEDYKKAFDKETSILSLVEKFKEDPDLQLELSDEEAEELFNYLINKYNQVSCVNFNGKVNVRFN